MKSKFFFLAVLLLLPTIAMGQVILNGTDRGGVVFNESEAFGTAVLNGGFLGNYPGGTVGDATINGGWIENHSSTIGTVTVNATEGGGIFNMSNGPGTPGSTITSAMVIAGVLYNVDDSTITTVTLDGGYIYNEVSEITDLVINGGQLDSFLGTTAIATMYGGTMNNGGRIEEMIYVGGTYNGSMYGVAGSIGTLNVAGDARNIDWGNLETANVYGDGVYNGKLTNYGGNTITTAMVNGGMLSSSGTITTAMVNGGTLDNSGTIGTVMVNAGGTLYNDGGSMITTAIVSGGRLYNEVGAITNVTVDGRWLEDESGGWFCGGYLENFGTITDATINFGGGIENRDGSTITNVTVNNGALINDGTIENATINDGGDIYNNPGGMITSATVNSGVLNNYWGGTTIEATVNGGYLFNYYSTITTVTQNGGKIDNGGEIDEMTYVSGIYNGRYGVRGRIGTLTLAGDSALNTGDWGIIENLVFDNGGNGIVSLIAFADGGSFGFNGIKAGYPGLVDFTIDFTYGNIVLDLTAFGSFGDGWISTFFGAFGINDGFYLSSLFGATDFSGVEYLSSLGVTWGDDSFWILNNGVFEKGWSINSVTGFVSYSDVPEPATLLMFGLGLAGLPIVRRLRKR